MTQKLWFAAALLVLAAPFVRAEEEHPFAKAKVGDWISWESSMAVLGQEIKQEIKQTVTKKTEDEVTLEIEMKQGGNVMPKQEQVIKLKEKYDPIKSFQQVPDAKITLGGTGDEKITVRGKEYATTWSAATVDMKLGELSMKSETKTWISKDVPLGGLVKMEMLMKGGPLGDAGQKMLMELTGSGSK